MNRINPKEESKSIMNNYISVKPYKKLPVGTIAAIVGTLLYVLSPVDLIPDFIPGIGYLDDAAVLALCLNFTRFDVEEYKKNTQGLTA